MSEGRLPVRGVRGNVQVRVGSRVCGFAEVAEAFTPKVAEPEALAEPLPVSPHHQQCSSGEHGPINASGLPVSCSPRGPVVSAARSSALLQASHAPSTYFEEHIKSVIPSRSSNVWVSLCQSSRSCCSQKPVVVNAVHLRKQSVGTSRLRPCDQGWTLVESHQ